MVVEKPQLYPNLLTQMNANKASRVLGNQQPSKTLIVWICAIHKVEYTTRNCDYGTGCVASEFYKTMSLRLVMNVSFLSIILKVVILGKKHKNSL
jgi:hypothetical protein